MNIRGYIQQFNLKQPIPWIVLFIIIITAFVVGGGGVYFWQQSVVQKKQKELLSIESLQRRIFSMEKDAFRLQEEISQCWQDRTHRINKIYLSADSITDWQTYKSKKYGFEFRYPKLYTLSEHSSSLSLTPISGWEWGGIPMERPLSIHIWTGDEKTSKADFSSYIRTVGKELCAAEGPSGSIYCIDAVDMEPFTNQYNINGYEFSLIEIHEKGSSTGTKVESRIRYPVYALDIAHQTNNQARAFVIESENDVINQAVVNTIINTLKF